LFQILNKVPKSA